MRKPLTIPIEKVTDNLQDELIDFRNDSACKEMFDTLSICEFWENASVSYQQIGKECIKMLLPFSITYLCEAEFSTLVQIEAKARNRLDVEDGMRCVFFSILTKIDVLVNNVQQQVFH